MEVQLDNERSKENSKFKTSCPHCNKSYIILLNDLHEEANRFVCKQCDGDFWVRRSELEAKPEPVMVGLATENFIGIQKEKCPKCGHQVESLDKECGSCGIIGAKYLALKEESPYLRVNDSLKQLWKRVLNHYDDERVHHEFLSQCLKENQLRYASMQYKQLKEAIGDDHVVSQMMTKIQNLSQLQMEKKEAPKVVEAPLYIKLLRWEFLFFAIGLILIATGLASPLAKNLIGLGVVAIAMPVLIWLFVRRS